MKAAVAMMVSHFKSSYLLIRLPSTLINSLSSVPAYTWEVRGGGVHVVGGRRLGVRVEAELNFCRRRRRRSAHAGGCSNSSDTREQETRSSAS